MSSLTENDRVAKHFHHVECLQLANQNVVVDFSIGYITEQICGYEMRDANCTVLTVHIVRVKLRFCKTVTCILSDYIKQEMNFRNSRFPEIPFEFDSGDSKMRTRWYVTG